MQEGFEKTKGMVLEQVNQIIKKLGRAKMLTATTSTHRGGITEESKEELMSDLEEQAGFANAIKVCTIGFVQCLLESYLGSHPDIEFHP